MGATILFGLFALFFIAMLIYGLVIAIKEKELSGLIYGFTAILMLIYCASVIYIYVRDGYSIPKEQWLATKYRIEYQLDQKDKYFSTYIKDAEQHNKEVNATNNLWFRFSKEDRSEYEINIEYYISSLITEE